MAGEAYRIRPDISLPDSVDLRTDEAHSARVYDYILGGKDNYAADRAAAAKMLRAWPSLQSSMRANRAFMHRVARYLADEVGITQFLDLGTGIPTSPNLHEVAQHAAPEARIVYVDNDPIVLTHARALLTSASEGRTAYVSADMREPESLLVAPELSATIDLSRPVALTVLAMVHFLPDDDAARLVNRLMSELPRGSHLALTTATADSAPAMRDVARIYQDEGIGLWLRTREQVVALFEGFELVESGVRLVHHWNPDGSTSFCDSEVAMYGGLARKT